MSARFLLPPQSTWSDVTADLPDDGAPLTLAKSGGEGALQISEAEFVSGPAPAADSAALLAMLADFGKRAALGAPGDTHFEPGPPIVAAASFRADAFVRVWYLSDGVRFALATYTCGHDSAAATGEVAECEGIVRTVRFQ
jgi:hypothetical protein